jgi:hypothetical protein
MAIFFVCKQMMFSLQHSVSFPDKLLKLLNRYNILKNVRKNSMVVLSPLVYIYFSKLDEFFFMQPKKIVISQNYSENPLFSSQCSSASASWGPLQSASAGRSMFVLEVAK